MGGAAPAGKGTSMKHMPLSAAAARLLCACNVVLLGRG
jgi:hypothetical protein